MAARYAQEKTDEVFAWLCKLSRSFPSTCRLNPPRPCRGIGSIFYTQIIAVVDSHIHRIVLATEKPTVTHQVSHGPIKCQSRSWLQSGTNVNGSHHGDNTLLKPKGVQIATKPLSGPTNREHRNLSASRRCGYKLQFLLSGVLPVFQNLNYKLQRKTVLRAAHRRKSSNMIQSVF